MPSERIQRQIDQHLDAAEEASGRLDWPALEDHAAAALALEPDNGDATVLLTAARQRLAASILSSADQSAEDMKNAFQASPSWDAVQPEFFAYDRYKERDHPRSSVYGPSGRQSQHRQRLRHRPRSARRLTFK